MEYSLIPCDDCTAEQIQQHVTNAFESVVLINELNLLEIMSEEEMLIKQRNIDHLKIMIGQVWFAEALTEEQTNIINQLIS